MDTTDIGRDCQSCVFVETTTASAPCCWCWGHSGKPNWSGRDAKTLEAGQTTEPTKEFGARVSPKPITGKRATSILVDDHARYPDDNPKTIHGLAKPPMGLVPGTAMTAMAEAFRHGAEKYGPANWRSAPVTTSTYTSAALRHLFAWIDGEEYDPVEGGGSGVSHLAHVMGCMAILIDAQAQGTLKDDRPTPGKTAEMIRQFTRPIASD